MIICEVIVLEISTVESGEEMLLERLHGIRFWLQNFIERSLLL